MILDTDTILYLIETHDRSLLYLIYSYLLRILIYCLAAPKTAIATFLQLLKASPYKHFSTLIEIRDAILNLSKTLDLFISLCISLSLSNLSMGIALLFITHKITKSSKYLSVKVFRVLLNHVLSCLITLSVAILAK